MSSSKFTLTSSSLSLYSDWLFCDGCGLPPRIIQSTEHDNDDDDDDDDINNMNKERQQRRRHPKRCDTRHEKTTVVGWSGEEGKILCDRTRTTNNIDVTPTPHPRTKKARQAMNGRRLT
mmetsp:Transcript_59532/g.67406  ORF Transcript_59532/g.67406 Transcript_59532/m.67406 type:complete len:119 (+) Transcript_59532:154-510(+)